MTKKITFHGACLRCGSQEMCDSQEISERIKRCKGCSYYQLYLNGHWMDGFPDLSTSKAEIKETLTKQLAKQHLKENQLRQLFRRSSDCYADTGKFETNGSYTEGKIVLAITEDKFIEIIKQLNLN